MTVAVALVFGLVFGSFAAASGERLAQRRSLLGRSRCDACRRELSAGELVPLLGYLTVGGRCRACHAPIRAAAPVIEAATALAFAAAFAALPPLAAAAVSGFWVAAVIAAGALRTRRSA